MFGIITEEFKEVYGSLACFCGHDGLLVDVHERPFECYMS